MSPVSWSVSQLVTLSDFHCVDVSGPSQSLHRPNVVLVHEPQRLTPIQCGLHHFFSEPQRLQESLRDFLGASEVVKLLENTATQKLSLHFADTGPGCTGRGIFSDISIAMTNSFQSSISKVYFYKVYPAKRIF